MFRSLGAVAGIRALHDSRAVVRRRACTAVLVAVGMLGAGLAATHSSAGAAASCDRSATPSTLSSQVSAAASGQTICLGAGDYGTWGGTSKAVTVVAPAGTTASMRNAFGSGDGGFTLDGVSGLGGSIASGARDITIRNSAFTSVLDLGVTNANVVLDHNTHDWNATSGSGGKLFIWNNTGSPSGVTVQNSHIANGQLDGIQIGGRAGVSILDNVFDNLCDTGTNHTDYIQFASGGFGQIAGNYLHENPSCRGAVQGITSYDGGTVGLIIEDNVLDIHRPWAIELYADQDSIVRHNTLRYYAPAECAFNLACGQIDINRKSADPAGTGTQVYDNLATSVGFSNGSTGTARNNLSRAGFDGDRVSWFPCSLSV